MSSRPRAPEEGDIGSMAAFSVLFLVPAALAASLWVLAKAIGLHDVAPLPALLLVAAPAVLSAAAARWACRSAGAQASTAWGFSIGAAAVTGLFMVVTAAWLVPLGD